MFNYLIKLFQGPPTASRAKQFFDSQFEGIKNGVKGETIRNEISTSPQMFNEWFAEMHGAIEKIFNAATLKEQRLLMRHLVCNLTDQWAGAKVYFTEGFTAEDREIICARVFPNQLQQQREKEFHFIQKVRTPGLVALRLCAERFFDDFKKNDFNSYYAHVCESFYENYFKLELAKGKNEGTVAYEFTFDYWSKRKPEIKQRITNGEDFYFDPAQEERKHIAEENDRKSKEPLKRVKIFPGEIASLETLLIERFNLAKNGQLYLVDSLPPKNWVDCMSVDIALMWIALIECCDNEALAEATIKEVANNFISKLSKEETSESDNNLDSPRVFVEYYLESSERKWLTLLMPAIVSLFYGTTYDPISPDGNKHFNSLIVGATQDAWSLYTRTKNIFGWKINTKFLGD